MAFFKKIFKRNKRNERSKSQIELSQDHFPEMRNRLFSLPTTPNSRANENERQLQDDPQPSTRVRHFRRRGNIEQAESHTEILCQQEAPVMRRRSEQALPSPVTNGHASAYYDDIEGQYEGTRGSTHYLNGREEENDMSRVAFHDNGKPKEISTSAEWWNIETPKFKASSRPPDKSNFKESRRNSQDLLQQDLNNSGTSTNPMPSADEPQSNHDVRASASKSDYQTGPDKYQTDRYMSQAYGTDYDYHNNQNIYGRKKSRACFTENGVSEITTHAPWDTIDTEGFKTFGERNLSENNGDDTSSYDHPDYQVQINELKDSISELTQQNKNSEESIKELTLKNQKLEDSIKELTQQNQKLSNMETNQNIIMQKLELISVEETSKSD